MLNADLFARTEARYARWDADARRNADIRRRVRRGEPITDVANHYRLSPNFVERIAGAFGG